MSVRDGADDRGTAGSPTPQRRIAGQTHVAGTYLTDEVFLYRVVGVTSNGAAETVELEDCYRLDVVQVSVGDLRRRRLQTVMPSPLSCLARVIAPGSSERVGAEALDRHEDGQREDDDVQWHV